MTSKLVWMGNSSEHYMCVNSSVAAGWSPQPLHKYLSVFCGNPSVDTAEKQVLFNGPSLCPSFPSSSLSSLLLSPVLPAALYIFILCVFCLLFLSPPPPQPPPPVSTYSRPTSTEWSFSTSHVKMANLVYICVNVCGESVYVCVWENEVRAVPAFLWHSWHSPSVALCPISALPVCVCEKDLVRKWKCTLCSPDWLPQARMEEWGN